MHDVPNPVELNCSEAEAGVEVKPNLELNYHRSCHITSRSITYNQTLEKVEQLLSLVINLYYFLEPPTTTKSIYGTIKMIIYMQEFFLGS